MVQELKFADDICNPALTSGELQLVLDATHRWAVAWGMEVGVCKTNAIYFPPPSRKPQQQQQPELPTLTVGGHPIQWVQRYRYLGYWTWFDLRARGVRREGNQPAQPGFLDEVEQRINAAWRRAHEAHSLIRASPPALSLQLFRTSVSGTVNYLLSLTEPTKATCSIIDRLSLKVARQALRLDSRCPTALAWAESRLPPAAGIMARERLRFYMQLMYSPFPSIAKRILMALAAPGRWSPRQRATSARSWVHRMLVLHHWYNVAGVQFDGVAGATNAQLYNDVKRAAGVYGRSVSLHEWRKLGLKRSVDVHNDDVSSMAITDHVDSSHRPLPSPPSQHCADLHVRYQLPMGTDVIGDSKTMTPLSARGPQCAGGLIALVTRQIPARQLHALGTVRQGRAGLFHYPLASSKASFSEAAADLAIGADRQSGIRQWAHNMHHMSPCRLCGAATEDPLHVMVECTHPVVTAARAQAIAALPSKLLMVAALGLKARYGDDAELVGYPLEIFQELHALLTRGVQWDSDDGRFLLFRSLAVLTWPASVCDISTPCALALGRLFDHIVAKTHRLRCVANCWVGFAAAAVTRILNAYNGAIDGLAGNGG